jgi:membrane-associated phospholipid phosphatase
MTYSFSLPQCGLRYRARMAASGHAPRIDLASSVAGEVVQSVVDVRQAPVPASVVLPRTRTSLAIIVPGIVGFAGLMALVRRKRLEAIDLGVTMRLQAIHHPSVERAMSIVSWFGFPPQSRLLPPIAVGALWMGRYRLEATLQLAAWGSALISTAIKLFMQRPRPVAGTDLRVVAAELGGSSFPSGHVLTYVGTYGWLAIVANILIRQRRLRRTAVTSLVALVAAVGPSRIYLGHHWPTDVAASYLLGSSYLAALVVAYRRLKSGRTRV